ncbi:MAG: tetratricopeptide repeat protein [Pyrinomonadaceae bacterium]|nr:tetratricopeptide repeat protein [Pyrinomonadaceae bacterium]
MVNDGRALLILLYAAIAVYLVPIFPHGGSANELTRWATAASLVENGGFEISSTEPLIGPNPDTAKFDGRTYSNKAPGTAVLSAPVYGIARIFVGPPDSSNIRISWYVMRLALATLPLLLLGVWLYFREVDAIGLGSLLFATPLFIYSLLFFSHVFAAVLVYMAFRLLFDARYLTPGPSLAAGLLAGMAVISEFTAVFVVAILGIGLLFTDKRERFARVAYFVIGGLPFAIMLLLYNNSLFGSPFSMSYAHESFPEWAEVASRGVFGIGFPTLSTIWLLLGSPSRGLFFFSPILLLAMLSLYRSPERKTLRHRVKFAAIVVSIIVLCGHGAAHGGWSAGARYLVLVLPLMLDSVFDGELYESSNIWQGLLFGLSFFFCVLPVLTFPFAPPEFSYPHNDFWFALLWQENWFTPNLAMFAGVSAFWSLVPLIGAFIGVLIIVSRSMRRPRRFALGLAGATVVFTAYIFIPGLADREGAEFRRATIAERYFYPNDRLAPFIAAAGEKRDGAALRQIRDFQWIIADVRAYAPGDAPYIAASPLLPSPTAIQNRAVALASQGRAADGEQLLQKGSEIHPFAACEMKTNLAVIYYTTGRRELAESALREVQPFVDSSSRPDCMRSQFLLGTLLQETGRPDEARDIIRKFTANSARSADPSIIALRRQLGLR